MKKMTLQKIFNADDFGISKGVNAAIVKAHREGILNSASLMINQKYAAEAVKLAKEMPELEMGLHVNLTNEYPAASAQEIPLLVDNRGKLKNGFVNLLLISFLKPRQLRQQVEIEMRARIAKYLTTGLPLQHLDSQMMKTFFKELRLARKKKKLLKIEEEEKESQSQREAIIK